MARDALLLAILLFLIPASDSSILDIKEKTVIPLPPSLKVPDENSTGYWFSQAQSALANKLASPVYRPRKKSDVAKSGILVIGSGMSVVTLRLARQVLNHKYGKEHVLRFEEFPVLGFLKHYCTDSQVGDDSCTATAYSTGIKTDRGKLGLEPETLYSGSLDVEEQCLEEKYSSIAGWAIDAGKSVGIVTTSKLTDPKVAALYGRTSSSYNRCSNLPTQMMSHFPGNKIQVFLGGGSKDFRKEQVDDWLKESPNRQFVENRNELLNISSKVDYLFGVFNKSDLDFHTLADSSQPSLEEMTEIALRILSRNRKGYFLFILDDNIGNAHQENKAILALDETLVLSRTVDMISNKVDMDKTLIVVTSDKGSSVTMSGYASRWSNPYKENRNTTNYGLPSLIIRYGTGPGYTYSENYNRSYLRNPLYNSDDPNFQYPSNFPLSSSAAGGEDVAMFVSGPNQHLFSGVREQHELPHLMAYSMCIGNGYTVCKKNGKSSSNRYAPTTIPLILLLLIVKFYV